MTVKQHEWTVEVHYPMAELSIVWATDDAARQMAGRHPDYSGTDFTTRDLGWYCESSLEASKIATRLRDAFPNMRVEVRRTQ